VPKIQCVAAYRSSYGEYEVGDTVNVSSAEWEYLQRDSPGSFAEVYLGGFPVTKLYVDRVTHRLVVEYDDET